MAFSLYPAMSQRFNLHSKLIMLIFLKQIKIFLNKLSDFGIGVVVGELFLWVGSKWGVHRTVVKCMNQILNNF